MSESEITCERLSDLISTFPLLPFLSSGKIQLKWVTESTDEAPEDVVPGTGHWSTFGLDGRMQPDNWLYRTSPPPADEAKVRHCHGHFTFQLSLRNTQRTPALF